MPKPDPWIARLREFATRARVARMGACDHPPFAVRERDAYTWAWWTAWRGAPDLVAHIARVSLQTVGGPGCQIEARIGEDTERFDSADEFSQWLTDDGLRRFDRLRILAAANGAEAAVTFNRGDKAVDKLLKRGVVVEVAGDDLSKCRDMRDRLAIAVDRGHPKGYVDRRKDDSLAAFREALEHARRKARTSWSVVAVVAVVVLVPIFLLRPLTEAGAPFLIGVTAGAVLGAAGGAVYSYLKPAVEVSHLPRSRAILRYRVAPIAGALIGIVGQALRG